MIEGNNTKAKHDKEHTTLEPEFCMWCYLELNDMAAQIVGGSRY